MNIEAISKILNQQLQIANKKGEVPVAAVLVREGKMISKAYNLREKKHDIMSHAEIICIKRATKKLKRWNLSDCELYVSLKPCSMCTEIIKQSRIKRVFYVLDKPDFKHEYNKTVFKILGNDDFENSYQQLLKNFFKNRRK